MVDLNSQDELKSFLIASQLLRADQWQQVEAELVNGEDVSAILQLMEGRHILTPLQTRRILKGDTEGLVLGNYKLLYRNASGGFARVYRAETVDGQETVAVKLLRDRWASDPAAVAGFHREARICQRFKHPNIVPIYDVGSEGDFHYFTMEFVEGGNLRDFLRVRETLSPKECFRESTTSNSKGRDIRCRETASGSSVSRHSPNSTMAFFKSTMASPTD